MIDLCDCFKTNKRDDPEFVKQEKKISDLLQKSAILALALGLSIYDDDLRGDINSVDQVTKTLNNMIPDMSNIQNASNTYEYKREVEQAMLAGSRAGRNEKAVLYALRKEEVNNGIVNSSKYFTNRYFSDQIIPLIQKNVEKSLVDGVSSRLLYDQVRAKIAEHYKSVGYWDIVAGVSASRGYSYGLVKGGLVTGYQTATFVAVMDERTTRVCRAANGRTWRLSDLEATIEAIALCEPSQLKEIAPWPTLEEIQGDNSKILVPPLHCRCRSTLSII